MIAKSAYAIDAGDVDCCGGSGRDNLRQSDEPKSVNVDNDGRRGWST